MSKCLESAMIMGDLGMGKTTQAKYLALYLREKFKEPCYVRLVSASGGGWSTVQPSVEAGLIKPFRITERSNACHVINLLSRGYWPKNVDDPLSPLLPPPHLKPRLPNYKGEFQDESDYALSRGLIFDDITSICFWIMGDLTIREARGEIEVSGEKAGAKPFRDIDTFVGAPARGHYLSIQNSMRIYVRQSKDLDGKYVIWTALMRKGTDERNIPVFGPEVIGAALTDESGSWFDHVLHLTARRVDAETFERRLYFGIHFENDIRVNCKYQVDSDFLLEGPSFLKGKPADMSIKKFFELLDAANARAASSLQKKTAQIPTIKPSEDKNA